MRAEMAARWIDALQSVGSNTYGAGVEAGADPAAKFWGRNVPLALEVLGKLLSREITPDRDPREVRLVMKAAAATIKAAILVNKNVLKAPSAELPHPLKFPQISDRFRCCVGFPRQV
jgi:hypothetical protein